MAHTVSDQILQRLHARGRGVRRVFGHPKDGLNGLMTALSRMGRTMQLVHRANHGELAVFMAVAAAWEQALQTGRRCRARRLLMRRLPR